MCFVVDIAGDGRRLRSISDFDSVLKRECEKSVYISVVVVRD